jgi:tetratricopeptide (TPR) repeat protein
MLTSLAIANLVLLLQPTQGSSAAALCEQALGNYRAKNYAAAVAAAAQAVQQEAGNAPCHHIYGLSLAAVGRFREAEEHLNRAIELKPGFGNYHYDLGFVLYQQKKYDASVPVLKRAVELDPENIKARFLLGRTYVSSHRSLLIGNFSELALEQFDYVARKNPQFPTVHYHIAQIHSNNGFFEKAQQELITELAHHPSNAQAQVALGELLLKKGQTKAALEQIQQAAGRAPNVALVHYALAKAYRENDQLEKAIQSAQKSLELEPTSPDAHYLLSQLYQENGQPELAQQELASFQKYKHRSP